MLQRIIEYSVKNRFLVILVTVLLIAGGTVALVGDPAGRHPGPLGRAGDRPDRVSRAGAPGGGGPGDLPPDDGHARGAPRADGPRLQFLRAQFRVHHLRRRHGHLLGPQPRAGVPELRDRPSATGGEPRARAGRHGRGLGLRVRTPQRPAQPGGAAEHPGLVPPVRTDFGKRRFRGCQHRRLRQAVPGGGRSQQAADLRHSAQPDQDGDPA